GDARIVQEVIECRVAASLRNVDRLLAASRWQQTGNGTVVTAMQTIAGVNYCLSLRNHGLNKPRLQISLRAARDGNRYLTPVPEIAGLTRPQIDLLRYRFTIDGWAKVEEVRARLIGAWQEEARICFDEISPLPLAGRLEGYFHIAGNDEPVSNATGRV